MTQTSTPANVGSVDKLGTTRTKRENPVRALTEAELNHLRRLLGWVRCEVGMPPDVMVQTVQGLAAAGAFHDGVSDEGKARLVEWHQQLSNVPRYVRAALKALEKTLAEHIECMPDITQEEIDAAAMQSMAVQPLRDEITRLRAALIEAESGLVLAGADRPATTAFVPSPTLALRAVRNVLSDTGKLQALRDIDAQLHGLRQRREDRAKRHGLDDKGSGDAERTSVTYSGMLFMDCKCSKCNATKRETWD